MKILKFATVQSLQALAFLHLLTFFVGITVPNFSMDIIFYSITFYRQTLLFIALIFLTAYLFAHVKMKINVKRGLVLFLSLFFIWSLFIFEFFYRYTGVVLGVSRNQETAIGGDPHVWIKFHLSDGLEFNLKMLLVFLLFSYFFIKRWFKNYEKTFSGKSAKGTITQ